MQVPPQFCTVEPPEQISLHWPPWQTWPALQAWPQLVASAGPQLFASLSVSLRT